MEEWNEAYEEEFEYTEDFDEDIDENIDDDFEYIEDFDEQIEKAQEEEELRLERIDEIESYNETWAEDIGDIKDPDLQEKEIESAEKMIEKRQALEKKLESGEITKDQFDDEIYSKIRRNEVRASTRLGLESVGITWDDVGEAMDELADIQTGDPEHLKRVRNLKKYIDLAGAEASQKIIDRALEDEKIDKDMHESLSRYIRLN